METATLCSQNGVMSLEQLRQITYPESTRTYQVVPHHVIVDALVDTLKLRQIAVVASEFAVTREGNRMFGIMELDQTFNGARFALGLRNGTDKTMRLALTCGYRVFVCDNMSFRGDFQPVLAKHSKSFNLMHAVSWGIDEMQRNFEPMVQAVELWKGHQLTDVQAKTIIYEAFISGALEAPQRIAKSVHENYFNPKYEEFTPRTVYSLENAFTSAFKELEPVPQYRATAALRPFIETHIVK